MRLIRIFNITALVVFSALWVLLVLKREVFQGDGLVHPVGLRNDCNYFSSKMPYGFVHKGHFHGFTSIDINGKSVATGMWMLQEDSARIQHFVFPDAFRFNHLQAVLTMPDSSLRIIGLNNDSMVVVIHYDSLPVPAYTFKAPSTMKAAHVVDGKAEIVFGRQNKLVGSIATLKDTGVVFRRYELPGFFDRICEIVVAYPEEGKWRFLLRTDYYRRNEKWIILDTTRKTNFLIFDERAVYPDFPGLLTVNKNAFLAAFDDRISGLLPERICNDSVFSLRKNRLIKERNYCGRMERAYWYFSHDMQHGLYVTSWDTLPSDASFLVSYAHGGPPSWVLPFEDEEGELIFQQNNKKEKRQIFLGENEDPMAYFPIVPDTNVFISSKLSFALLNADGVLIDQKNFFTLVNSTVYKHYPQRMIVLDAALPEMGAMISFFILYGLPFIWIISLVVVWLVEAIKNKPKFAVREKPWSFSMRLLPGTIIYLISFALSIIGLLHGFGLL